LSIRELLGFLDKSPSSFHAVWNMKNILIDNGFTELNEKERWQIKAGGNYFVTRNDSAIIAFSIPEGNVDGFRIAASHSDSPAFKIKENPEITVENKYVKLNTEGYGGMILSSWLDRPLSVAGRIIVKENGRLVSKLVNVDRDLMIIPNLAIHMNREINKGYVYNKQKDMLPLFAEAGDKDRLMDIIKEAAETDKEILGHDLYLYN
jgi:aspartyl aminopeptidase